MKDLFHSLEKSGISDPKSVSEQWSPVRDEERTRVTSFISAYTCDFGGEKEGRESILCFEWRNALLSRTKDKIDECGLVFIWCS